METIDALSTCTKYHRIADELMAHSTPEQLAECARLLALNLAHQGRHGAVRFEQLLATLQAASLNDEQITVVEEGMQTLVAVIAFVRREAA